MFSGFLFFSLPIIKARQGFSRGLLFRPLFFRGSLSANSACVFVEIILKYFYKQNVFQNFNGRNALRYFCVIQNSTCI